MGKYQFELRRKDYHKFGAIRKTINIKSDL